MSKVVYLIGSLRNEEVPKIAKRLRDETKYEIFDQWFSAGRIADDEFQAYATARNWTMKEALQSHVAKHIFEFDKRHIDRSDAVVLVMPAGKSGHLELGYSLGKGKKGYVLFPNGDPERFDQMYQFATDIFYNVEDLLKSI